MTVAASCSFGSLSRTARRSISKHRIEIKPTVLATPVVSTDVLALIARHVLASAREARATDAIPQFYAPLRLLLEIEPLDLVGLDWENLLSLAPLVSSVTITRFRAISDMRVVRSFELPLGVLHAQRVAASETSPTDAVMKYFRYHRVSGISDLDLDPIVRSARSEVVHLAVEAAWADNGATELSIEPLKGSPKQGITVASMGSAMSSCRARLLILQCVDEDSFVPALNFAHRLLRAGGPSTLVLRGATSAYLDKLYMSVVHDNFRAWYSFSQHGPIGRAVLFHGIGGDRVLELRPVEQRMLQDLQRTAAAGARLLEAAQEQNR